METIEASLADGFAEMGRLDTVTEGKISDDSRHAQYSR